MKKPLTTAFCSLLIPILLTISSPARGEDSPQQILLLPFNVYAPQDYDYLKNGIAATLNSRLQRPGITPLVPTEEMMNAVAKPNAQLTQKAIQTIAVSLGASLAIEGNVTIVGDAVSTAIQLWEVPGGGLRINFHAKGDRPEAVLEHIDQFIQRLETTVPGTAFPNDPVSTTIQTPAEQPMAAAPAVSWQSQRMPTGFKGMAIADLTPAPGQEIAIINDQDLLIYKRHGDDLNQLTLIKGKPYLRLVAVDAGDINANGRAEIFVSAFHTRLGQPRSFVVEWNSSEERFVLTFEKLPTYFRITAIPHEGEHLVGQPMGSNSFFGKRPALMQWENKYLATTPLELPAQVQLYDFILGPFAPGGAGDTIVALTHRKKIQIYQAPDTLRWTSEDGYGGSSVYLDDSQTTPNQAKQLKQVGEETLKRLYLHPRMLLQDLDNDGHQDLLVVRNKDATGGLFRRARLFTSGRIACLNWQPLGPVAKWETPKVSGHITDMALDDSDGNGQSELLYLVVENQPEQIGSQQSYLVSHNLNAIN